ncbi:MAG TPA: hypothetical protein VNO14_03155 [Blastocatellia bacterium]|nr:hypothetical protein [Blastocatellia bacterium]
MSIIRAGLRAYADRGVFRAFEEMNLGRGRHAFTFLWLTRRPLELNYDAARDVLTFKKLLPNIPSNSAMYAELKSFLKQYHNGDLPRHRLIDEKRASVSCSNRGGHVSIAMRVKDKGYEYGLNKLINLAHDVFVHLQYSHADYMCENFDLPQE